MATTPELLNKNAYLTFDANSLHDLIIDRLNKDGVFTDQNYQGSNLSALIDIIAYSFSTLLYYLNKTSSESMFSDAQIYENMNRIIKLLNYKPIGKVGQSVPFKVSTTTLPSGNYVIPRYSYILAGNTAFSFTEDLPFTKKVNGTESITDLDNIYNLKQGLYVETPAINAVGIDNETIFISTVNQNIDHFGIDVYVKKENETTWDKWERVNELFTKRGTDKCYEVRFNQNKNYEIKFGDDINGLRLNPNDQVVIYYLKIDPKAVNIGVNGLNNSPITIYNSLNYKNIFEDTNTEFGSHLTASTARYININNEFPSTDYSDEESVDSIRKNAPKIFRTQNRLVTTQDFETYISNNFGNILSDVRVMNNDEYLKTYIKYFYNIGLKSPQLENNVLYNQIKFSTSCNFNNVYFYAVPKNQNLEYMSPAQKEVVINSVNDIKILTSNVVPVDPVYIYIDFYVSPDPAINTSYINTTNLHIYKKANTKRSSSSIISDVVNTFTKYFSKTTNKLGQKIDTLQLNSDLLSIDGVEKLETVNTATNTTTEGLSFLAWNSLYPALDAKKYNQNFNLELFQFPIFNNISNISNKIKIVENSGTITASDF